MLYGTWNHVQKVNKSFSNQFSFVVYFRLMIVKMKLLTILIKH